MIKRLLAGSLVAGALIIALAGASFASTATIGTIWLDGQQVRTVVTPAQIPGQGTDPFYKVPGTGGVASLGPGQQGYDGGSWQVYLVSFNVTPYQLTSASAVLTAEAAGAVTVTRAASQDFRCPILP